MTLPPSNPSSPELPPHMSLLLSRAYNLVSKSWEHGTFCETLLEVYDAELSVFGAAPFGPVGLEIPCVKGFEQKQGRRVEALKWAGERTGMEERVLSREAKEKGVIEDRAVAEELVERTVGDDAAGDPSSLGIPALLLGTFQPTYHHAALAQAAYILNPSNVPRFFNGAISHRYDVAELWSDFIYMVPPFLAYLAVATSDECYLRTAIEQIGLYRDVLMVREGKRKGLWRHIVGPKNEDLGCWGTGNGWAAMGIARVWTTLKKWRRTWGWVDEGVMLKQFIKEIIDGVVAQERDPANGLLRNYLDDETWFGEVSGTAMLAAAVYRMAIHAPDDFGPNQRCFVWAEESRKAIEKCIDESGLVKPVVNPLKHLSRIPLESGSPEGQCFAAMMFQAYHDFLGRTKGSI